MNATPEAQWPAARRVAALLLAWLIALAAPTVRGQEPADDGETLELASEVVLVPMAVRSTSGRAVADLTAADFVVTDNGAPQEIAFFRRDTAPIDVVMLVDTSSSTGASLELLERSATAFASHLRREDSFALYTFAEKPVSLLAWTNDARAIVNTLTAVRPAGDTMLYLSTISVLRSAFAARPADRRRAVVVFTDGLDTGSGIYTSQRVSDEALARDVTISVVSASRHARGVIDEMIVGKLVEESTWPAYREMQVELGRVEAPLTALAERTGGRAVFPAGDRELSTAFAEMAEELRSRYVLGFYVPATAAAGFHTISVRATRDGVTVYARGGYFHDAGGAEARP
jgi:Ca-activated chloride channel homolog